EREWFRLWNEYGLPVHTFRLAGIYGPGRNALETVKQGRGRRINKPGQVFSRIHIDDITQILRASMLQPNGGRAYNVCDDNPAPPEQVIAYACQLLSLETPPLIEFEDADLSPMARSFYRDNKRVSNQRIKDELGVVLKWPDYRDALKAILD
ncbi:MAG: SDR family NAD(P)-dependent oxidoreductase, partial [Alphaproteobacteria bacterium]|nr:SDR family NAD(P)-dependent oxidoreductase [Alphaproteobacteria bacterium]